MSNKRQIEVFSAGCPACAEAVDLIHEQACGSCEVTILDMRDADVAARAKSLGVTAVPAVAVNGKLLDCCTGRGVNAADLQAAGVGKTLP